MILNMNCNRDQQSKIHHNRKNQKKQMKQRQDNQILHYPISRVIPSYHGNTGKFQNNYKRNSRSCSNNSRHNKDSLSTGTPVNGGNHQKNGEKYLHRPDNLTKNDPNYTYPQPKQQNINPVLPGNRSNWGSLTNKNQTSNKNNSFLLCIQQRLSNPSCYHQNHRCGVIPDHLLIYSDFDDKTN